MKPLLWTSIVLIFSLALILGGCQSQPAPVPTEEVLPEYPAPQIPTTVPDAVYPPPIQSSPIYNPYPGPSEGIFNYVEWSQVESAIANGQVAEVYQAQTMHVTVVLADGSVILALEPEIDAVFGLIDQCGDPCKDIVRASE